MARIQVERAHTLGKDAAREKADKLASNSRINMAWSLRGPATH